MRPVLAVVGRPEHVNSASWVGRSDEGGRLRVGSAGHGLVGGTLHGAGGADLTDGRAWDRLSSGDRTLVRLAIDDDLANNAVGLNEREKHEGNKEGEGGQEESGSLHCVLIKRKVRGCKSLRENTFRGNGKTRVRKRPAEGRKGKRERDEEEGGGGGEWGKTNRTAGCFIGQAI